MIWKFRGGENPRQIPNTTHASQEGLSPRHVLRRGLVLLDHGRRVRPHRAHRAGRGDRARRALRAAGHRRGLVLGPIVAPALLVTASSKWSPKRYAVKRIFRIISLQNFVLIQPRRSPPEICEI